MQMPQDNWRVQVASDVLRDGLGVELLDEDGNVVVELFRCDADHSLSTTLLEKDIPAAVLVWFGAAARRNLGETHEDGSPVDWGRFPEVFALDAPMHTVVEIDTARIDGWDSFHDVFAEVLGFPYFYGRNMNAWIDCMVSIDEADDGLTEVHAPKGGVLVLSLSDATGFAARCPEIYHAIVECSAFVNYARMEVGESPVLALSFWKKST